MMREQGLALLDRWYASGWVRSLDLAFARFLGDLDPQADALVLIAGCCVSAYLGRGHICLPLRQLYDDANALLNLSDERLHGQEAYQDLPSQCLPQDPAMWLTALTQSSLLMSESGPLVLAGERLYLRRYWRYEVDVAQAIKDRVAIDCVWPDDLRQRLDSLFPETQSAQPDWQKIACALAVRKAFAVITGGPGTGKTTTVLKMLALLQSSARQQGRVLRIVLAAPTGKAAARLSDSILSSLTKLPEAMQRDLPHEACTLHKLLGARPGTRHFTHNRHNPLHADVVIIDEASMIDLDMMASLLNALRSDTRLIMLGDKDQLASVEAGSVLGDLCRNAEQSAYDPATRAWLQQYCGQIIPGNGPTGSALDQQIAVLRISHRFDDNSGIGRLATAVNAGQVGVFEGIWQQQTPFEDIRRINIAANPGDFNDLILDGWGAEHAVGYRYYLEVLKKQRPAVDAPLEDHWHWASSVIAAFDRFQLLCALREGSWGVEGLNQRIAEVLYAQGLISQTQGWYEGRPVLVNRNDYALGLMNGDIGIALNLPDVDSGAMRLRVVFKQNQQAIKSFLPSRLNDVESVYAMTVHKSQGSEFEHVALVMPDSVNPVLTRELIYTGITRARKRFSLLFSVASVLPNAVSQRVKRASGLADGLL